MSASTCFYHNPELAFEYYVLIPHVSRPEVLMLFENSQWVLPHFTPYEHASGAVDHINRAIATQLHLSVTTARLMRQESDPATKRLVRTYLLENHSPGWIPPANGKWISYRELGDLPRANQQHLIKAWFEEETQENRPINRLAWSEKGWFQEVGAWIGREIGKLGHRIISAVEQVMVWEQSCVLRVKSTGGMLYFKASPPMYSYETTITQTLAKYHRDYLPCVLATNEEQHWLLMKDLNGQPLMQTADIDCWYNALAAYAQVQKESIAYLKDLRQAGLPDRHLANMSAQVDWLFADFSAMQVDREGGLSQDEVARLQTLKPGLEDLITRLANGPIPATIEHGDLHPHNIHIVNAQGRFFDWSLSSCTHPFFSLAYFLHYIQSLRSDIKIDLQSQLNPLRDAYMQMWDEYGSPKALEEILGFTKKLLPLHWALNYHQVILPKMDLRDRWLRERGVPFHLRQLLEAWPKQG